MFYGLVKVFGKHLAAPENFGVLQNLQIRPVEARLRLNIGIISLMIQTSYIYIPSQDIVSREIEGEVIIVPITAGIGDMDDEIYTLNDIGREIWHRLDGKTTLAALIADLAGTYDAPLEEIRTDVCGFVTELARRKMLVQVACNSL